MRVHFRLLVRNTLGFLRVDLFLLVCGPAVNYLGNIPSSCLLCRFSPSAVPSYTRILYLSSHPVPIFLKNLLSCLRQVWHLDSPRIYLIVDHPLILYSSTVAVARFGFNGHYHSSGWDWGPTLGIYPLFSLVRIALL